MSERIELQRIVPTTPQRLYRAWLDGPTHAAMTGGAATVESREVGGRFTAWDGYIDGVHLALEPGRRIFQSWRSDDFPADAPESHLEVRLARAPGGTRVTLVHREIPDGQGPASLEGCEAHYLEPMIRYFKAEARRKAKPRAKPTARRRTPARRRSTGPRRGTSARRARPG
jgi:uncharacterized protein YndB with AHSA1/START domain